MKISEIKVSYSNLNENNTKITSSKSAYDLIISNWNLDTIEYQEEVKILMLNRANFVLGIHELSKGGTNCCIVDIKMVLSISLKCNADSIILIHNHPSGNLNPSESDKILTMKINDGCKMIDINLLDHLIITNGKYYSFRDEGFFE